MIRNYKFYLESKSNLNKYIEFYNSEEGKAIFNEGNYFDAKLGIVTYYDSFSNDSINKLVKKILKLDKNKYNIKYSNFHSKKNKQYIQFQNTSHSTGIFCDIKFIQHSIIESVEICWCQRSNYNAMFEFRIKLRKAISSFDEEYNFILSNLNRENLREMKFYQPFKYESPLAKHEIQSLLDYHYDLFKFTVQSLIVTLLHSENGQESDLFSIYSYQVDKLDFKDFKAPYLGFYAKNKIKDIVLVSDHIPYSYNTILSLDAFSKSGFFYSSNMLNYFAKYRNIFYFSLYFDFEMDKLNQKLSKYGSGAKKHYSSDDLMWTYKKLIELESSRDTKNFIDIEELNKKINEDWEIGYGHYTIDKPELPSIINCDFTKDNVLFLYDKYKEQYEFYKVALESQTTGMSLTIAFISLSLAIVSIVLSIVI